MKKRILTYMKQTEQLLITDSDHTDWEQIRREHLIQISFFQHERLVHLLVTMLFAVLAFLTLIIMTLKFSIPALILFLAILTLLIPYITHYYLLV